MSERREYKRFEILGIANDELICLESITNVRCCGEKSGQIHIITMRPLSEETIENQKSEENLKDIWEVQTINEGINKISASWHLFRYAIFTFKKRFF